jgi:WD40 repeat protein
MTSSASGNLVFVAFSDNSLKVIDTRSPDKNAVFQCSNLQGGHENHLVKSLLVSSDESVLYSGGTDSTVCVWDVNHQQVVQTFG